MNEEPPRRPRPVTKEHAEEVAKFWHEAWCHVYGSSVRWEDAEEATRECQTEVAFKLLDGGWIMNLTADETMAVVECLMEAGVTWDASEAAPVTPNMQTPLLTAFQKLAFANGRHYGLTNFDMGIEEDT